MSEKTKVTIDDMDFDALITERDKLRHDISNLRNTLEDHKTRISQLETEAINVRISRERVRNENNDLRNRVVELHDSNILLRQKVGGCICSKVKGNPSGNFGEFAKIANAVVESTQVQCSHDEIKELIRKSHRELLTEMKCLVTNFAMFNKQYTFDWNSYFATKETQHDLG